MILALRDCGINAPNSPGGCPFSRWLSTYAVISPFPTLDAMVGWQARLPAHVTSFDGVAGVERLPTSNAVL